MSFDSSILLGYYQAKLSAAAYSGSHQTNAQGTNTSSAASQKNSATAGDVTPWTIKQPDQANRDAMVLGIKNFVDTSKVPILAGQTSDSKTEQDNQKLFALYTAVNNLAYLASMSKRDGMSTGQMAGFNARFQTGLQQIQDYIAKTTFNNFTLQAAAASSTITGTAAVPAPVFGYTGSAVVKGSDVSSALPGISRDDSFNVSVKKGTQTIDVAIDLNQVQGDLTIDNVLKYVNTQLAANGVSSRFKKVITQGSIDKLDKAYYSIGINAAAGETLSLNADDASPALYLSATSGLTTATKTAATDSQGRLVKLSNLDDPQTVFSATLAPDNGTSTAQASVVDKDGNVYMIGNATGDFGSQLNQGVQDVYLSKYDSAGNQLWTHLLGSADTASAASLALNPNGGVTVVGTTTADLTTTAVANGNQDSFVTRYDANGSQQWTTQIQTLNKNQAASVSVDSAGNVYLGGQTTGAIGKGQVKIGGSDAYLIKLDNKGKVVSEQQFGTTGNDTVAATALTDNGDLMVASVQNGQAVLSKYAGGDTTAAPTWQLNLGDLQNGGAITGLAVSGGKIYISGTTQNGALNAPVAQAASGGSNAFVISASDNGSTASANYVSYLGTSAADKGGAVTVGPDGTVYVTGTTAGTFDGQTRTTDKTTNMFVAALQSDGTEKWVRQYGGLDGQSAGMGIAIDTKGSSVLDALGLPHGTVNTNQTSDLLSGTTLRPGDSFKVALGGTAPRTFTITIDKGETLQSLVTKLNGDFVGLGKASISYSSAGSALKIDMKKGITAKLISGPGDFDALARLGLQPGLLSDGSASSTITGANKQTFGLGINPKMDITTAVDARSTYTQLLSVLTAIQKAYQTTNTPVLASTAKGTNNGGTVNAFMQSQMANYDLALNILTGGASSTSVVS